MILNLRLMFIILVFCISIIFLISFFTNHFNKKKETFSSPKTEDDLEKYIEQQTDYINTLLDKASSPSTSILPKIPKM